MAKKLYYKIGEACKSLDIQPYVLRYWETEFPALKPNKSKSGQRVYSDRDLEVIRRIKELLYDEGYTIAGAKKKLEGEGAEAGDESEDAEEAAPQAVEAAPKPKVAAKPAKPAVKPAKAAAKPAKSAKTGKKAAPAPAKKSAAAAKAPPAMSPQVRKAVKKALADTRELLALLDKKSG